MINEILNYTIIRKIGEGSMGQVFLAKNKSIHQFVAIKMLNPRYGNNPVLRDRFRQEAIMLSALNHPNIVKFLNYVENEHGIFLIMEYVDGMTLEDYLTKKTGLLVEEKAFPMMTQILDAFAYAHDRNVVHRDIKPSNIFVTKDGSIKILDFGIAQIISEADGGRTDTYGGTVEYMSPEQVQGKGIDTRSDIYSLGVVFHQMLTGKAPYDTTTLSDLDIKRDIVSKPLGRMKAVYPYISDQAQALVDKATRKDPEERFRNCNDMKSEVARICQGAKAGGSGDGGSKKTAKIWIFSLLGAIVLIGLGVLAFIIYSRNMDKLYPDYVDKWGIAEGFGEMPENPADSLGFYKVVIKDGKTVRVTLVNASGQVAVVTDSLLAQYKPVDIEYVYREDGKLDYKNIYDQHGTFLYKVQYDEDLCEATVERANDSITTSYKLVHDQKTGRLNAIHYTDKDGNMTAYRGVYGEKYDYDKEGRLTRVTYLDEHYEPGDDETGIGIINFDYGGQSLTDGKASLYDRRGKPTVPRPVVVEEKAAPKKQKPKAKKKTPKETFGPVSPVAPPPAPKKDDYGMRKPGK